MTVVASFVGGWGHAEPLLPVAERAAQAGQRVVFAGQAAIVPRLADRGYDTVVVGPDTMATEPLPLVPVDRDAERRVVADHFVRRFGAERAETLAALFERERPEVVVCDEVDVGAVLAAEQAGIPAVTVSVIAAGRLAAPEVIGTAWSDLRRSHGLAADDECRLAGGSLMLAFAPPSFRDPVLPRPPRLQHVRPAVLDRVTREARPSLVYATLGTIFNLESGDLLTRVGRALDRVDGGALLTVGPHLSAHDLGVPAGVRVENFVPQEDVLGRCRAVVCHGGSGTLIAALSLGVPVVVLPMGADQPDNADRCEALGVGIVLDPLTATPATIHEAVDAVVRDGRYAAAARELAAEAAALPSLDDVREIDALLSPDPRRAGS